MLSSFFGSGLSDLKSRTYGIDLSHGKIRGLNRAMGDVCLPARRDEVRLNEEYGLSTRL